MGRMDNPYVKRHRRPPTDEEKKRRDEKSAATRAKTREKKHQLNWFRMQRMLQRMLQRWKENVLTSSFHGAQKVGNQLRLDRLQMLQWQQTKVTTDMARK